MPWDRRTSKQQQADLKRAVKAQVLHAVGPFSPYWKERLVSLGTSAASVATPAGLGTLPPVGERDVCPDGNPASAAALVLQAGEAGWAVHTEGPQLRRALVSRLARPGSYRAVVEADSRPTTFVEAGLGLRYPIASTRHDLDVVARAGARLWRVLGLRRADVLVLMNALGADLIHKRAMSLTSWLLDELARLRHGNGSPLVRLYGPLDARDRGPTVAFNVVDPDGAVWDCWQVERLANERQISLRAGCHCNPGAREAALEIEDSELEEAFAVADALAYPEFMRRSQPTRKGVVRVSAGLASNFADVERFRNFLTELADHPAD